jgi:hypothetical protein
MFIARTLMDDLSRGTEMRHFVPLEELEWRSVVYKNIAPMERKPVSGDAVGCLWLPEKVFARLLGNQSGVFQFKVSALNLAFIDGEFLRQHCRRRECLSGSYRFAAYLPFNLFADLQVHWAFR